MTRWILNKTRKRSKLYAGISGLGVALMGALLINAGSAATFVAGSEAESGIVGGKTGLISDAAASGSAALKFGAVAVPNPRSIKGQPLYMYRPADWAGRPAAIYDYQVGRWYGNWTTDLTGTLNTVVSGAAAAGQLPLLVAYNIPGRDCGQYSSGGAGSSAAYRAWIQSFAAGVGNRKAIIVLEPDALAQVDCLKPADQNVRIADIAFAAKLLNAQTQASVYIDGGNSNWKTAASMAQLVQRAGVADAAGFSLNVSNFRLTDESAAYGDEVVLELQKLGIKGVRYVVDTSRNGRGPAPDAALSWCNPAGRGLGQRPTTSPVVGRYNDAYLWIKTIGESDGECGRGEPAAGQWFPTYAQMLMNNTL